MSYRIYLCTSGLLLLAGLQLQAAQGMPENLARKAVISAGSEYNHQYQAKNVADGKIPAAGAQADVGRAWCVNGSTHRSGSEIRFEWSQPVLVGEIVYYGRTAFQMGECWKGYQVLLAGSDKPVLSGELKMVHGPQRITFARPIRTRSLLIHFRSSYGGSNPGASEIEIYPAKLTAEAFGQLEARAHLPLSGVPQIDRVDCDKLYQLIQDCRSEHGVSYRQYERHLSDLRRLRRRPGENETQLSELQRAVLLFDVNRLVAIKRHEIKASHVYTYHYEGFKPGGGLYVFDVHNLEREPLELVNSPTGQILDCDLSYDGKIALFSWRRREDAGYHLWTIRTDGSDLKQITDGAWHDYNACWLPGGGIAFLSSRSPQFAYCWHAPVGIVYRMNADGTNIRKISANYLNDFTPYTLHDGRIIYSRWEYVDKPAIPIQSLWTINPDGTNLSMYFGNGVISPGTFMEPRQIPGTNKIICTMTGHNGPTRGAIGIIDRSQGLNAQAAIENITPDVHIPAVDEGNGNTPEPKPYSCPLPLDGTRFLVSASGPVLVRTVSGDCQSTALPRPDDGMQYFCAQPIRPRLRPATIASTLTRSCSDKNHAFVYLQDVYKGLEPSVKRGQIKRIRIVQEMSKSVRIDPRLRAFGFQFPVISCGATYAGKKVLGEVPVEADGSAYFRVPAGVPIYFMALDEKGRALQRMRSFTHLMPGETQGCVGCHEPRRQSPPAQRGIRAAMLPQKMQEPEWGVMGFDYSRIVQPILDEHCTQCHNPIDPPKGIDLTGGRTDYFNVSYDVLARDNQGRNGSPYISWIPTYNGHEQNILEVSPMAWGSPQSKLAQVVISGHPDENGRARIRLDDKSRRRILAWIDLNVPYYGSSETAYPENVGCRRIYPDNLDSVLAEVVDRRCSQCHDQGAIPRRVWTRITEPELNNFLLAPLAKAAGGSQKCGTAVFADTTDPDYRAILVTFEPISQMLKQTPRMDMPGGRPAPDVCRDCQ
ncbi:MAG: hypothetical protein JSW47_02425 [Phycisphaerales bacterium]|nr:MAG: hypothetical protein JSW47_02425 [Phycisphaerales bacterium]